MRILQVVHQYAPHYVGGTEMYTQSLSEGMAERGHEVAIFTRVRRADDDHRLVSKTVERSVTLYRLFEPEPADAFGLFQDSFQNQSALRAFANALEQIRPDLVHVQHLKGLHHAIPHLARARGIPLTLTLHDYWYYCGNAQLIRPQGHVCGGPRLWLNCADCAAHRVDAPLLRVVAPGVAALFARREQRLVAVLRAANRIIAPSQFVYDAYARRFGRTDRMRLIEHGIRPLPTAPPSPANGASLRILFAGGLSPQKGAHVLLEALRALPDSAVTLDLCGDESAFPDYVSSLKEMARGLPVCFHGVLDRPQLAERMAESDVLAVPSLWPETVSLVSLEAQAVGLPILASDVGAMRERIRSAADGWLVPPGDVSAWIGVLRQLIYNNKEALAAMHCRRPAKSLAAHLDEIERIYSEVAPTSACVTAIA